MSIRRVALALVLLGALVPVSAAAQDRIIANVNGKPVTEVDIALAANELGPALEQLTETERLRTLLEVVVEHQLLADAAEKSGLNSAKSFQQRLNFARRKLLRDEYVASRIVPQVTVADARKVYDEQRAAQPPGDEIRVLHMLVETEVEAKDLRGKAVSGADFRKLAQQFSKDTGSNWNGGDLGYVGKGQINDEFEAAAFALAKGKLSEPFKTRFGWHLLLVEDRRPRALPEFEAVKDDLMNHLAQRRMQDAVAYLIGQAKIEIVDPEVRKTVPESPQAAKVPPATKKATPAKAAPQSTEWSKGIFGQ